MFRFRRFQPPAGTVATDWGLLRVEAKRYAPLDEVAIEIGPGHTGAETYRIEWFDGLGRSYGSVKGDFHAPTAVETFLAGGAPGMQFVRLWLDGAERHCRLVNFYVEAETDLRTGDPLLDAVYPASRDAMRLNRRRYKLPEGTVTGYTTADSVQTLAYWLRDMFYNLPGYMLWEHDVTSGFGALFARQHEDGSLPDGVRDDGSTWRMITESDVEYLAVLALWRTWLISGDDAWLRANLRAAERALEHLRTSPLRWDTSRGLVRRAHTCDTWDFSIYDGDRYSAETPAVAALCDQTGYGQALLALAEIHTYLGNAERAAALRAEREAFVAAANAALWDGEKFRHHVHLDHFDHGSFDEAEQLVMSNGWAVTRGFADSAQARQVIQTWEQRQRLIGDPLPWWSLQPGYPEADYPFLAGHPYQHQGGYCNGGLMPWAGGAICHAAFLAGEEAYGCQLLRDYAQFLHERDGEIYTWYWPNGEPGFRTANTTGHDGWAMGHWLDALFGGLAGLTITGPALSRAVLTPRWHAWGASEVNCTVSLPASETYLAYRWYATRRGYRLLVTGVCDELQVRLPAPSLTATVTINGDPPADGAVTREGDDLVCHLTGPQVHHIELVTAD